MSMKMDANSNGGESLTTAYLNAANKGFFANHDVAADYLLKN